MSDQNIISSPSVTTSDTDEIFSEISTLSDSEELPNFSNSDQDMRYQSKFSFRSFQCKIIAGVSGFKEYIEEYIEIIIILILPIIIPIFILIFFAVFIKLSSLYMRFCFAAIPSVMESLIYIFQII
ncbi:uncharacterized protein KGF55_001476 [Candida pseudojiufengensis]|uniref:uncharacterized protein n=1 Tax=Candida pseudojiufengensis TaxID=497109 RepID=UPI0022244F01|nr:uncharacterized protein KGF55_001476 [Candida pseudojiufengensis]KAI5965256.1 hypothetical protein KGF55_001476 [Candida pseudojiufengensis]